MGFIEKFLGNLNVEGFLETLPVMGMGMAGIFVVIIVIYLSIKLLCKIFPAED